LSLLQSKSFVFLYTAVLVCFWRNICTFILITYYWEIGQHIDCVVLCKIVCSCHKWSLLWLCCRQLTVWSCLRGVNFLAILSFHIEGVIFVTIMCSVECRTRHMMTNVVLDQTWYCMSVLLYTVYCVLKTDYWYLLILKCTAVISILAPCSLCYYWTMFVKINY